MYDWTRREKAETGASAYHRGVNVLLLDSYNLLYRSFSSLPPTITGADGQPINAVYGMLSSILRLWREGRPDHIIAAFDLPEVPNFRSRMYPPYQMQRGPLGGEFAVEFAGQVEAARRLLPLLGIPAVSQPGYEADDVMGTLAQGVAKAGGNATIVSTDRDLTQLVGRGIRVLIPSSKEPVILSTDEDVRSVLGVDADGVTTFKALAGDVSDNIPGVRGIGRVGAVNLVNEYHTLERIYASLDQLRARTAAALEAGKREAYLFRDLVSIRTDLEVLAILANLPAVDIDDSSRVRELLGRPDKT